VRHHRWRVGNIRPLPYAFTYDHEEVHRWYERAGLEKIRPVGANSGVGYIATKPPADSEAWGERA
jgi:hypothetical protein